MISTFVTIQMKLGFRDRFVEAVLEDGKGSAKDEPGCFRFDVLQDDSDPNRIHWSVKAGAPSPRDGGRHSVVSSGCVLSEGKQEYSSLR